MGYPAPFPGMIQAGNIDLSKQPAVKNRDGSVSTVRSITIGVPGGFLVIPTVHPAGRIMSNQEAIRHYQDTGAHLGYFQDEANANRYAVALHQNEAQRISRR